MNDQETKLEAQRRINAAIEDLNGAWKRLDEAQQKVGQVTTVADAYAVIGAARVTIDAIIGDLRSALAEGAADLDSDAKQTLASKR